LFVSGVLFFRATIRFSLCRDGVSLALGGLGVTFLCPRSKVTDCWEYRTSEIGSSLFVCKGGFGISRDLYFFIGYSLLDGEFEIILRESFIRSLSKKLGRFWKNYFGGRLKCSFKKLGLDRYSETIFLILLF